jgi:hypothetical protein
MRQARTVRFTERDDPLDTVLSVSLMTRASSLQLRRGGVTAPALTCSAVRYATRAMCSWTVSCTLRRLGLLAVECSLRSVSSPDLSATPR